MQEQRASSQARECACPKSLLRVRSRVHCLGALWSFGCYETARFQIVQPVDGGAQLRLIAGGKHVKATIYNGNESPCYGQKLEKAGHRI